MHWKPIQGLNFGYADAQNYKDGRDTAHFEASFLADKHAEDLKLPKIYFLIGEKGTGKTAYATYLSYFSKGAYNSDIVFVQPTDYADLLSAWKEANLSVSDFSALWQIALLVTYFRNCTISSIDPHTMEARLKKLNEVLTRFTFSSSRIQFSDVFNVLRNIEQFCDAVAEVEGSEKGLNFSGAPIRLKLNFLRQNFLRALADLPQNLQYTLFVDGIDIRPDYIAYDSFIRCVSGLCDAVWILNSSHLSILPAQSLRIVLLVRPDILSNAGLQNLNLKTRDNSLLLDWITDYKVYRNSSLFQLTDKLLAGQQDEVVKYPGDGWDHYFPFSIENRTRKESSDNPFINFLRHSFYKPRDIILYLEVMKNRIVDAGSGADESFTFQVFRDRTIRKEYSNYLLGEVRDSLAFYYRVEEFEVFLRFFDFLGQHVDKSHREFSYSGFTQAYDALRDYAQKNTIELPVLFRTADILLQFLYELNILCFRVDKPGDKYPATRWCFRERSFANIQPKVRSGCNYVMHYGIARALYPDIR
jgi:hypothetical protein